MTVLALVVLREFAVADRAPPPVVLGVPARGGDHSFLWGKLGCPPEGFELGDVHAVAAVVTGPVGDVANQRLRLTQGLEHDLDH